MNKNNCKNYLFSHHSCILRDIPESESIIGSHLASTGSLDQLNRGLAKVLDRRPNPDAGLSTASAQAGRLGVNGQALVAGGDVGGQVAKLVRITGRLDDDILVEKLSNFFGCY